MTGPDVSVIELGYDHAATDSLVELSPESGFMQSTAWAAFKEKEGYTCARYGFMLEGRLTGLANLFHFPGEGGEGLVVCPEGPVLDWQDTELARESLRALVRGVESDVRFPRTLGVRIEPHLPPPAPSLLRNWSRAPVDLTPIHTLIIDLTQDDDALLSAMHPKARYNLRLAERHGVEIQRTTDMRHLSLFFNLLTETSVRGGFFHEPYGFFLNLGSTLFPTNSAEIFLASWQGECIASLLVVYFGRRATYLYGGSTARCRHVMPNHLLHWSVIQAARVRGCAEYDLYGYEPFGIQDHLYAGISRFKVQLGGKRVDSMGARDHLFYDRLADRIVDEALAIAP